MTTTLPSFGEDGEDGYEGANTVIDLDTATFRFNGKSVSGKRLAILLGLADERETIPSVPSEATPLASCMPIARP